MNDKILQNLNNEQCDAVQSVQKKILVLAGAGSGKTRVLVNRIAWLLENTDCEGQNVLAVTFTNKAANEMKHRLEYLIQSPVKDLWVGTFHSIAHKLLRRHAAVLGLNSSFKILDSDDQLRLIKRIIKEENLDERSVEPKSIQAKINQFKDKGLRSKDVNGEEDFWIAQVLRLYREYERLCNENHWVDFADLLLKSYELMRDFPEVREYYQNRFKNILIDEFQDTNWIQYQWILLMSRVDHGLFLVGDDDQSIYGWRGARVENMQQLEHDFDDLEIIRLEQNYRSTPTILKAANQLISNNTGRLGKKLWSDKEDGEKITAYQAEDEIQEAKFVVNCIARFHDAKNCAILYRSNAQSRILESTLIQAGIAYQIYGGQRFYERLEIKNSLAYLRLLVNPHDKLAFERVVNVPNRGVGEVSLLKLNALAEEQNCSLWEAVEHAMENKLLSTKVRSSLEYFVNLIKRVQEKTEGLLLAEQVKVMLSETGLIEFYETHKDIKERLRVENLQELINAVAHYSPANVEENSLEIFLNEVTLESDHSSSSDENSKVQLMTVHSAKGLEFPVVFLVGLEEGLFPHGQSSDSLDKLEEERRLCYVGMTRAENKLYLSHAKTRRFYGNEKFNKRSRFLKELPPELITINKQSENKSFSQGRDVTRSRRKFSSLTSAIHKVAKGQYLPEGLRLGQKVQHKNFGTGMVMQCEGDSDFLRVLVNFQKAGEKWLVWQYANLEIMR